MPYTTLVSTELLAGNLNIPGWVIIDCRFALGDTQKGKAAYSASHIPGARYAHLDDDLSGPVVFGKTGRHPLPDIEIFSKKLGNWGIDDTVQVVAYDDMGGPFAARLWWMLKWLGHDAVAVLDGGWSKWIMEERPVEIEAPDASPRHFEARVQNHLLVDAETVERASRRFSACLLDARASERFAGIHEPIDPVAGHIPSALSVPWMDNLGDQKCFLPPEILKKRFEPFDTASAISYCGSGVTAAHNLLAIAHAGLPLPKLYAGSWSEWITSPNHRIATD